MNSIEINIFKIQHIKNMCFYLDLTKNNISCIVGKNSVGKTTLIKAIKNITASDTFSRTSSPYIFESESKIVYKIDNNEYIYKYNEKLNTLDTKEKIDKEIIRNIVSELPIPYGERFSHFQKLGNIDNEIRQKRIEEDFDVPHQLIELFKNVYHSTKFDNLKEIKIKQESYFVLPKENGYYIREDYFSSGEHFIINLYRLIKKRCKLIVIDELDISLDAMAQVNMIEELRKLCLEYETNIVFTTHSLAIMKMLKDDELFYMENNTGNCSIESKSYNYIKSLLYQFEGWDKYILTEDKMLQNFLEYILLGEDIFSKYKIIYIGGGWNVVDLMKRNTTEKFLSDKKNVLSILDGDVQNQGYCQDVDNLVFLPFESVEKQLKIHYDAGLLDNYQIGTANGAKDIYNRLVNNEYMSQHEIFEFLITHNSPKIDDFKIKIKSFLNNN